MTKTRQILILAGVAALLSPPSTASAHHAPGNSCTKGLDPPEYNAVIRTKRFQYHVIRSTLPAQTRRGQDRIIRSIRFGGMRPWNTGRTDCHYPRFEVFSTAFISDEGSSYDDHNDGRSTIDFGDDFACTEAAIACASHEFTGANFRNRRVTAATDIRFRSRDDLYWYPGGRKVPKCRSGMACYDLRSAAAHEVGHAVGLANFSVSGHRYQTMFSPLTPGRSSYPTRQRTLGRVDYVGLKNIYEGLAPLEP